MVSRGEHRTIDPDAPTFGLTRCLLIPISAVSVDAIRLYVGEVLKSRTGRNGRINAVCVRPQDHPIRKDPRVRLWLQPDAGRYEERLHPERQVWVHVDYREYRKAYLSFDMPPLPAGYFLDHVQNREAVRLRAYSHPYLRLCPVSRLVNTSGGSNFGGEGMEKEYLRSLRKSDSGLPASLSASKITYADPMDITKMLDLPPGTGDLSGVRDIQGLFYSG